MKLVIGGAFQGKLDWAKRIYGLREGWADGSLCGLEEIWSCPGMFHFHEYVLRAMEQGMLQSEQEGEAFARRLLERNPGLILVTNELGYGIVPTDAFDRRFREMTGRICTGLAAEAEEVVRVVCGLGVKLKEAKEEPSHVFSPLC